MSQLTEEIDRVVKSIIPRQPIYKLALNQTWRGPSISFKCMSVTTNESDSFITRIVMDDLDTSVDFTTGRVYVTPNRYLQDSVKSTMRDSLASFIYRHSDSKNPKLTTLYRWYYKLHKRYSTAMRELNEGEKAALEDLLFNVWKYTETKCNTASELENGMKILEFVKAKYETQLKGVV